VGDLDGGGSDTSGGATDEHTSPGLMLAWRTRASKAVVKASANPPACSSHVVGNEYEVLVRHRTQGRLAPPPTSAHTLLPRSGSSTSRPTELTTPASSIRARPRASPRGRVEATSLHEVRCVNAKRMHRHDYTVGPGLGLGRSNISKVFTVDHHTGMSLSLRVPSLGESPIVSSHDYL